MKVELTPEDVQLLKLALILYRDSMNVDEKGGEQERKHAQTLLEGLP